MISELPDDKTLEQLEARAVAYAREAGHLMLTRCREPHEGAYKSKGMRNPVTDVDRELEALLRSSIARDFPDHAILGEEGTGVGAESSPYCWVLDPLDGTTNFVNGLPLFAVSIGVLYRLVPVVGAIFSTQTPFGSEGVFHAAKGRGARLGDTPLRIIGEDEPSPNRLTSVPGSYRRFEIDKELRKRHGEPRVLGSVAVEMALTGAGVFQFAVFGSPKIWDVAAGVLIVQEAGGAVLVGNKHNSSWETLERFSPSGVSEEEQTGLRSWARPLIVGSPGIAAFVAQHLRMRPKPGAKARSGSSPAGGKRGSQ